MTASSKFASRTLPARAGIGLKAEHYRAVLEDRPRLGFFEIHAENYMGAGGPPHRYLTAIREAYPLSLHGVGLSIGGPQSLDRDHLARLKSLDERYEPGLFSEHLAWSTHDTSYLSDLLPLPYTDETLARVCDHIDETQEFMGRQMLLENPSSYLSFEESTYSEPDFIAEVARRTGCGLLLDVNNVFVASTNHAIDARAYLASFPMGAVGEIHLAGHLETSDDTGAPLLIDTHDRPVADPVWSLFAEAIAAIGPMATLIEWDGDIPAWPVLRREAESAEAVLDRARKRRAA